MTDPRDLCLGSLRYSYPAGATYGGVHVRNLVACSVCGHVDLEDRETGYIVEHEEKTDD